jgi:hypothetical protein
MNGASYGGTNTWALPTIEQMKSLYDDLGMQTGDPRLEWPLFVGPFLRLQPGFYWACVSADNAGAAGPCDLSQDAPTPPGNVTPLEWSFNFDDGFEGTDLNNKQFYVMVYFPVP